MDTWRRDAVRLRLTEGREWGYIFETLKDQFPEGLSDSQIKRRLYDAVRRSPEGRARHRAPSRNPKPQEFKPFDGYNAEKGVYERDRLIEICETDEITDDLILKLHNLDPSRWCVVTYRNNYWHSQKKGGKRMIMYQSKLTVKPTFGTLTFEDVEAYFADKSYPTPPTLPNPDYSLNGDVLEIDIADPHYGLLAWVRETGADYNVHIARERFLRVISENVTRSKGRRFKRIILAFLGDLLHVDNDKQTTTNGTFQQADGRIAKIFEVALDTIIDAVRILGDIAPVEVIYTSGNHDGTSGWMLIKALQMAFINDPNVIIDAEPNPQKTVLIGNALVGLVHGDMPEKNQTGWLQVYASRKLHRPVKFIEIHKGHKHAQKVKEHVQTVDNEGIIVRTMPKIASSSSWEHREGYAGAICTSMSFVWDEETGLQEMWFVNM